MCRSVEGKSNWHHDVSERRMAKGTTQAWIAEFSAEEGDELQVV